MQNDRHFCARRSCSGCIRKTHSRIVPSGIMSTLNETKQNTRLDVQDTRASLVYHFVESTYFPRIERSCLQIEVTLF